MPIHKIMERNPNRRKYLCSDEDGKNILILKQIENIKLANLVEIKAETNNIESLESFSQI